MRGVDGPAHVCGWPGRPGPGMIGAMSSFRDALAAGPVVLDGGLATHLEARGNALSTHLWSARMVLDDPDEVVAAHRDFFAVGAQVATTASYQASFDGLARLGMDRGEAADVLRSTVRLADRARRQHVEASGDQRPRWVAASVGPYGAALADGSEYTGDYDVDVAGLAAWHRPRLQVLAGAGADVLALETIPCLAEVEALLGEVDGTGWTCWLSLTCDGDGTRRGEPLADAFGMAAEVDEVVAVGVNCCHPGDVAAAVASVGERTSLPAVAYPNSGEDWDAAASDWAGDGIFEPGAVVGWLEAGARLVGGCCRVTSTEIAAVVRAVDADPSPARR